MNTDHLKSFIAIADSGSITKAASRLYITPPSLHQQLSLLEREIGCPLFIRSTKGVVLTEAGTFLYPRAKSILASLEDAIQGARSAADIPRPLKIGYYDAGDIYQLDEYLSSRPAVRVQLINADWNGMDALCKDVRKGIYDLVFCEGSSSVSRYGCCFYALRKDRISVVMSPAHPFARKKSFPVSQLLSNTVYINSLPGPVSEIMRKAAPDLKMHLIEETSGNIMSLCYQGSLFIGEHTYLRKISSLPVIPLSPKAYIDYGVLYSANNKNPYVTDYLTFISHGIKGS